MAGVSACAAAATPPGPRQRDLSAPGARARRNVEETEALVTGVEACGNGKWADIKKLGFRAIHGRSAVDLKDKWRNLLRVALMPSTALKCGAGRLRGHSPALGMHGVGAAARGAAHCCSECSAVPRETRSWLHAPALPAWC